MIYKHLRLHVSVLLNSRDHSEKYVDISIVHCSLSRYMTNALSAVESKLLNTNS